MTIVSEKVKHTITGIPSDPVCMPGKLGKRRDAPTREALRFKWLIEQFEALGVNQSEVSRRTGIETSYINKVRNLESTGRTEIGASIVRKVKNGLKVDTGYFYDDYEGPADHRLYPLSAMRDEKRVAALENSVKQSELAIANMQALLAQQHADFLKMQQLIEAIGKGGANVNKKRSSG